jgi:hypothetical protein
MVNSTVVQSNVALTWGANNFSAGQFANRLKFYVSTNVDWKIDDLCLRTVSGADSNYDGTVPPAVDDINALTPRRIYVFDPVANGDTTQWTASDGTTPNYQAATDPTGAKYVVANAAGLTDLYKFQAPAGATPTGITAVSYRGSSTKSGLIQPVKKVGSTTSNVKTNSGPNRFIGFSETDGTSAWTEASIEAAAFGQTST